MKRLFIFMFVTHLVLINQTEAASTPAPAAAPTGSTQSRGHWAGKKGTWNRKTNNSNQSSTGQQGTTTMQQRRAQRQQAAANNASNTAQSTTTPATSSSASNSTIPPQQITPIANSTSAPITENTNNHPRQRTKMDGDLLIFGSSPLPQFTKNKAAWTKKKQQQKKQSSTTTN